MGGAFRSRLTRVLCITAGLLTGVVPSLSADPITVTSGQIVVAWDDPPGFTFSSAESGFFLTGVFPVVLTSPRQTCFTGCLPGTAVDLTTLAGGQAASTPFTLGLSRGALINGKEFGDLSQFGPTLGLAGTFRFEAPTILLPTQPSLQPLTAPFLFSGQVTGYGPNDPDALIPLFHVTLAGRGTARLEFLEFVNGTYQEPEVTYTFAPVPEPASWVLVGLGLAGLVSRRLVRRM